MAKYLKKIIKKYKFPGSIDYWDNRYASGQSSGRGSYGELAEFKAEVVNSFIEKKMVASVIEFGCGDGNQISMMNYPDYIGIDVSRTAIKLCADRYIEDKTKSFFLYDPDGFIDNHSIFTADLAISFDVIYHLVEDENYRTYMGHLFRSARKFVVIYSSNKNEAFSDPHILHRKFTDWIEANCKNWKLIEKIENKFKYQEETGEGSWADFSFFEKF